MKYVTIADLTNTIRGNLWKIPRDIDCIIGVPRSGMIAASIISSFLNVPLIDINSFIGGKEPWGGLRLGYFNKTHLKTNKVLVIDDTVSSGRAMKETKRKLSSSGKNDIKFVYACVYLEGWGCDAIDLYLDDLRQYTNHFKEYVLYEWNIFQHHVDVMDKFLFDVDGVFCVDPPDEKDEENYINYIKNASPLFIPRTKIGGIITYRLIKNKEITEKWLSDNNIRYNSLTMFDAMSWDERDRKGITSEQYKGEFYKKHNEFKLFIESNDYQAKEIARISSKPVYCVETNKLYQPPKEIITNNISNTDIFIGTYKDFTPKVSNKAYKIIVGNKNFETKSNLEVIKCRNEKDKLDDTFFSEIYMFDKLVKMNYSFKDYVGFCHYRKYWKFMDDIPNMDELFKDTDAIVSEPLTFETNMYEQYKMCHNIEDIEIVRDIVHKKFTNYEVAFESFFKGNVMIPYNMFIMKKEDFIKYIEFVRGVLDEYIKIIGTDINKRIEDNKEKYIKDFYPNNTVEYQYRIGGYLAERLTNVFILGNFTKLKAYPVIITEEKYNLEDGKKI